VVSFAVLAILLCSSKRTYVHTRTRDGFTPFLLDILENPAFGLTAAAGLCPPVQAATAAAAPQLTFYCCKGV